jgi:response regulator RpfG family c-di-GMP phosphodiesterase
MKPGTPESESTRTILLVEDEETTRLFIQRFLEREGYAVTAVDAAEEGIVEAGETPPDVLIADIHLPGLSGIELASFLLAQDPMLPVILMTGDPDEELARRALAAGPVQYLLKPFEWFEMQAAVRYALEQRDEAEERVPEAVLELTDEAVEEAEVESASVPGITADWFAEVDRGSWAGPGHGDRVARLAIALMGGVTEAVTVEAQDLSLAGRVHEVGRLHLCEGSPGEIAMRSAEVLAEAGFPNDVAESVRYMHERWDGTAGPGRPSGSRIPVGAQLLAVADALDHYVSAWIRSGLAPEDAAARALNLVTVQQNQVFSPLAVGAMHRASDALRCICTAPRPSEVPQAMLVPAMAAAESVPFALFATD